MPTTQSGIWYPGPGDPVVPFETSYATMAASIESVLQPRLFATTTARDSAYASQPFKMAVVGSSFDTGVWWVRQGGAWTSIDPISNTVGFQSPGAASDPYSVYSNGISVMYLTSAQAVAGGWPGPGYCFVTTWRIAGTSSTSQLLTSSTIGAAYPFTYMRSGNSSGWSQWAKIVGSTDVPFTNYTPVLTTSGTPQPTGYTALGRYQVTADMCYAMISVVLGSSVGSGTYSLSLPVPVGANWLAARGTSAAPIGHAALASGGTIVPGYWNLLGSTASMRVPTSFTAMAVVSNTVPITAVSGMTLGGTLMYGTI